MRSALIFTVKAPLFITYASTAFFLRTSRKKIASQFSRSARKDAHYFCPAKEEVSCAVSPHFLFSCTNSYRRRILMARWQKHMTLAIQRPKFIVLQFSAGKSFVFGNEMKFNPDISHPFSIRMNNCHMQKCQQTSCAYTNSWPLIKRKAVLAIRAQSPSIIFNNRNSRLLL